MIELYSAVIDVNMVDAPQKAIEAAGQLKAKDVELVFIFISTYALYSTILAIVQHIKVPVILLNVWVFEHGLKQGIYQSHSSKYDYSFIK